MKKVILGTGLLICGVLGILASIIKDAIYFASPNSITSSGTDPIFIYAIIILVIGIVLNIMSFIKDKEDDEDKE